MLYSNTGTAPRGAAPDTTGLFNAVWLDLCSPTDAERAAVAKGTGLDIPAQSDLAEIESSSRLSVAGDVLTLSMPMAHRGPDGASATAPLGFVLSPRQLVTIRFADMALFDRYAERFAALPANGSSAAAFAGLDIYYD